jgi:hypothetical protein
MLVPDPLEEIFAISWLTSPPYISIAVLAIIPASLVPNSFSVSLFCVRPGDDSGLLISLSLRLGLFMDFFCIIA